MPARILHINTAIELDGASSIILSYYPWSARGEGYLDLTRREKATILWDKVREDETSGPDRTTDFFVKDLRNVFDEKGDEHSCDYKSSHSKGGTVARVKYESTHTHPYTGIFKGADSGFLRTSDVTVI